MAYYDVGLFNKHTKISTSPVRNPQEVLISIPDRPARSQSIYRLSYPALYLGS